MIFVEDQVIKLNGVVLPGLVKSIEVTESAKVDEQEVEGSATKPKQATGYPSGVNDIDIIDAEVRKVKEGSSRPEYGIEERNIVEIREWSRVGLYDFPICGRLRCGQHPGMNNNVGYLLRSQAGLSNDYHEGSFGYHLSGTMRAQQPPYIADAVVIGQLQNTASELLTAYQEGQFNYVLSGTTRLSQGEDNGASGTSEVETAQEFTVGLVNYPRSGQYRAGQRKE